MQENPVTKTILLVEDDAIVALDQERRLRSFGYSVIKAYSGESALEVVRENRQIDLILMDIDLGAGMDGTEAAKEILRFREHPIVFVTSHSERSMVEKVKDITRYGYILKSAGEFVLAESIEMALNLFDSHRRLAAENRQHRQTREILAEKTIFLESTFEAIQDGISVLDADLNVRHVNGVMERWYQRNLPLEGKKCYQVYHDRSMPCEICPTIRCLETGTVERSVVPGAAGSPVRWIELFAYPMKDPESGKVTSVVEFVRDITDRHEKSEALRESERRSEERRQYLEAILNAAPVAIVTVEPGNIIREWNRAAEELFGYGEAEAKGSALDELISAGRESVREAISGHTQYVRQGKLLPQTEDVRYRKDGSPVQVIVSAAPISIEGEITGAIISYKDISQRKTAERAIRTGKERSKTSYRIRHREGGVLRVKSIFRYFYDSRGKLKNVLLNQRAINDNDESPPEGENTSSAHSEEDC